MRSITMKAMSNGRLRMRAKLARATGYFALALGVFWFFGRQGPQVWEQYVVQHSWPVATAVVQGFSPHSRTDLEKRQNSYVPVYWMEFTVALDLPSQKCPSPMRRTIGGVVQCVGTYKTVWTDSQQENWRWGSSHPVLSRVQVHYDPSGKSGSMVFFAGEALKNTYPWNDIAGVAFTFMLAILCFISARSDVAEAERLESEYGEEADIPDDCDGSALFGDNNGRAATKFPS